MASRRGSLDSRESPPYSDPGARKPGSNPRVPSPTAKQLHAPIFGLADHPKQYRVKSEYTLRRFCNLCGDAHAPRDNLHPLALILLNSWQKVWLPRHGHKYSSIEEARLPLTGKPLEVFPGVVFPTYSCINGKTARALRKIIYGVHLRDGLPTQDETEAAMSLFSVSGQQLEFQTRGQFVDTSVDSAQGVIPLHLVWRRVEDELIKVHFSPYTPRAEELVPILPRKTSVEVRDPLAGDNPLGVTLVGAFAHRKWATLQKGFRKTRNCRPLSLSATRNTIGFAIRHIRKHLRNLFAYLAALASFLKLAIALYDRARVLAARRKCNCYLFLKRAIYKWLRKNRAHKTVGLDV